MESGDCMALNDTMTALMDKARKLTGLTEKISIARLTGLMDHFDLHVNPNLFTGANDFSGTWYNQSSWTESGTYQGMKVMRRNSAWLGISQEIAVQAGQTYTFSFYAKASQTVNNTCIYVKGLIKGTDNTNPSNKIISLDQNWQKNSFTFKVIADGYVAPRLEAMSNGTTIYICGYKLEVGDLATPFDKVGGG